VGKGEASGSSGLDNLGRLRDVKYYEFLYELLAKQYELAKIDEAKDAAVVQVMDKAVEPDRKTKPKRALIVILSMSIALLVGIILAFVSEAMANSRGNPRQADRWQAFRRHLSRR
jgi:uncharacterized protein involved in exopolysaccharide biosynthesis